MKFDSPKVLGLILLVILALIIISIFSSGKKEEIENVAIGIPTQVDGESVDPESLLSKGTTLMVDPSSMIPRPDFYPDRPEPKIAPRKIAELHREAVEKTRKEAMAVRESDGSNLDSASTALLDSMRRIREIQEAEGTR